MKTIGLLGGMSWESTVPYYQIINTVVKERLGGLHSAKIVLYSVDFDEIEKCQAAGDWEKSGEILGKAAQGLEAAGAELLLICTNTMHKVLPQMEKMVTVPFLHIADATADELIKQRIQTVGLLGTKYTMTQDFYRERLIRRGLDVLIPEGEDIETVNDIIYKELCLGEINESSRAKMTAIVGKLRDRGAQGVILGCTEIGLLVRQEDSPVPVFDTTVIHARCGAEWALSAKGV